MLTRLWNGWPNIRVSILARVVELFIPPKLPYLPPPASYAVITGDYLWRFEGGQCMQLGLQFQLMPRLRVSGAEPPFLTCPHDVMRSEAYGKLYFYLFSENSGPGSSVGVATGYGMDGPRIESR
jgi:hypothetical protein